MNPCQFQPALRGLRAAAAVLLALAPGATTALKAQTLPSAPPLNPAWAFDPNGPFLPGADPPSFLLPANG
jgi:hypothetical protein